MAAQLSLAMPAQFRVLAAQLVCAVRPVSVPGRDLGLPVAVLKPAFAAAASVDWVFLWFMKVLIWWSVT